jgi:hypothetical protein
VAESSGERLRDSDIQPFEWSPAKEITPSFAQDAVSATPPATVAREDAESLRWAVSFDDLRTSFLSLETQLRRPPEEALIDGGSISPPVTDFFGTELQRVNDSLQVLEFRPVVSP